MIDNDSTYDKMVEIINMELYKKSKKSADKMWKACK